jgi:hypothetical protein
LLAVTGLGLQMQKMCCQILLNLCSAWIPVPTGGAQVDAIPRGQTPPSTTPVPPEVLLQFLQFLWDVLAPGLFAVPLKPEFNISDAQMRTVCDCVVRIQVLLAARCIAAAGLPSFVDHVSRTVLPALGGAVCVVLQ